MTSTSQQKLDSGSVLQIGGSIEVPASSPIIRPGNAEDLGQSFGLILSPKKPPFKHGHQNGVTITRPFHPEHPYHGGPHASTSTPRPSLLYYNTQDQAHMECSASQDPLSLPTERSGNPYRSVFLSPTPQHRDKTEGISGADNSIRRKQLSQLHRSPDPFFAHLSRPENQLPSPPPSNTSTPPLHNTLGLYVEGEGNACNIGVSDPHNNSPQSEAEHVAELIFDSLNTRMYRNFKTLTSEDTGLLFDPEMNAFAESLKVEQHLPYRHPASIDSSSQTTPSSYLPSSSSISGVSRSQSKSTTRRKPYRRTGKGSVVVTAAQTMDSRRGFASITESQPAEPNFPGECLLPGCTVNLGHADSSQVPAMGTRSGFKQHLHEVHHLTRSKNRTGLSICLWPGCHVETQEGSAARHVLSLHGPRPRKANAAVQLLN